MQKPQRKPVRAGALVDALNHHDERTKQAMQGLLVGYHEGFMVPLEARIAYLEAPFWSRWLTRLRGRG